MYENKKNIEIKTEIIEHCKKNYDVQKMEHRIAIKYIYVLCDCSCVMFHVFIIK